MPQDKGEEKMEDTPSPSGITFPSVASSDSFSPRLYRSGLGGVELSEPLPLPSRKSFLLKDEELRVSCTVSHGSKR